MKFLSETKAFDILQLIKWNFQSYIAEKYENRAKNCQICETPGACCMDAHFVNVHISRLEAAAIRNAVRKLPDQQQKATYRRVENAIEKYSLTAEGDTFEKTYACPLFEPKIGCLVHSTGKPLPCIAHACYEKPEDLPPDNLQIEQEVSVDDLNLRTYGRRQPWLPLPVAIRPPALPSK